MKMHRPFFSIATVVLNNLVGVRRTWDSLRNQKFDNWEWIVVDGVSADGTIDFVRTLYDARIRFISQHDSGLYDAMNKATALAQGEYVCYLNSGDFFSSPETLVKVRMVLAKEGCDVILGGANYVFPAGNQIYRAPRNFTSGISHGNPCVHQAAFFRRNILGTAPYDLQYGICGDYYLFAHLYTQGISSFVFNQPLVDFEMGGLSHRRRAKLFREAAAIQRSVLQLGTCTIYLSMMRRWISYLVGCVLMVRRRSRS
jgi:putative colanic acid biosynthesis glycosyltransferase